MALGFGLGEICSLYLIAAGFWGRAGQGARSARRGPPRWCRGGAAGALDAAVRERIMPGGPGCCPRWNAGKSAADWPGFRRCESGMVPGSGVCPDPCCGGDGRVTSS